MKSYGIEDGSYIAAGKEEGIRTLVAEFYHQMATLPEAKAIFSMHSSDVETSIDKLACFLCGWLGGPKLYSQKYQKIRIPVAHQHLNIGISERDAWLLCMQKALALQPYADDFKVYLLEQLFIPAERSRNQD